ncbi:MAG: hypothetical protein KY455_08220 [Euryarchaeota archaeon]|nr:hypothetical protein [Euryarchaeota archaeon]
MMRDVSAGIAFCKEVADKDPLHCRLTVAAIANTLLEPEGLHFLVVGGTAVDTYVSGALGTSESYPARWQESLDIDAIPLRFLSGASREEVIPLLEPHGFVPGATRSSLRHPDIPYPIDLVGYGFPDDYSPDHQVTLYNETWEELTLRPVYLAGAEDILFDYLESGVDTRHQKDWTRALAISTAMLEDLDLDYLYTKAHWRQDGALVAWLDKLMRGEPLRIGPGLRPY